jgi:dolichyl-phosphate beta-glucosyltransferase
LPPYLSIIIPAHNEELRLPDTLAKIIQFLDDQTYTAEVLIVENGSHDRTAEVAQSFADRHDRVSLLQEPSAGKGLAVKRGMLEAKGDYRFICDADLSMPIEEVNKFLPLLAPAFDIAIASREVPGARRYGEPPLRHIIGRIFNYLVRLITLPGIHDTQCGFKCFRAAVSEALFPQQTIDGWTFDVEILFLAQKNGYRIVEIPIPWYFDPGSRVRVMHDSLVMLGDLFRIRLNWISGKYGS